MDTVPLTCRRAASALGGLITKVRQVGTVGGAWLKPPNSFSRTGSPRSANQRPPLWVVLLLVAVALVLGVGVSVGLSGAKPRSSRKSMEGDRAQ